MANEPLEIYVKKGLGGEEETENTGDTPNDQENTPKTKKGETSKLGKAVNAQIVNIAKQSLNMAIRNYGELTGNAETQRSAENIVNVAGAIVTLKVAGPIIGSMVLGAQAGLSLIQSSTTQQLQRRQIEFNNARLGGIIKNGNR